MLSMLKDHPFAVEAGFESSIVLTFALPREQLQPLIPPCLTLDVFEENTAFLAVAMVSTKGLRPKGFPKFMGNDFFLIGYRIFVRYTTISGKKLRGLYIIKSETDKRKMEFFGNIFTHYNYTTTDISQMQASGLLKINSNRSNFNVDLDILEDDAPLPPDSPFHDWKEARRFAGPLPFTFTFEEKTEKVLIIEGVRTNWTPKPLKVKDYHFGFLNAMKLENAVLANAFIIKNVPYYWKKGKTELWTP
jgi:hypothetical protein